MNNIKNIILEILKESNGVYKHDTSYFDDKNEKISRETEFNTYGVDDELTILFKKNIDITTVKEFLKIFNDARKKIENKFKLKLGSQYQDPDASYKIWFGKNVVFDDNEHSQVSAEYVRGYAEHSPNDSFYFNLPKVKSLYDDSKNAWIPNPDYKLNRSRMYNVNKIEDIIIHEIAHALYFQQPKENRQQWLKYYDDGGWGNATSLYGQESATELFAETIVDIINDEKHKITDDLLQIFNFKK